MESELPDKMCVSTRCVLNACNVSLNSMQRFKIRGLLTIALNYNLLISTIFNTWENNGIRIIVIRSESIHVPLSAVHVCFYIDRFTD